MTLPNLALSSRTGYGSSRQGRKHMRPCLPLDKELACYCPPAQLYCCSRLPGLRSVRESSDARVHVLVHLRVGHARRESQSAHRARRIPRHRRRNRNRALWQLLPLNRRTPAHTATTAPALLLSPATLHPLPAIHLSPSPPPTPPTAAPPSRTRRACRICPIAPSQHPCITARSGPSPAPASSSGSPRADRRPPAAGSGSGTPAGTCALRAIVRCAPCRGCSCPPLRLGLGRLLRCSRF